MKENLIRKTKWFLPWQDREEEVWLEEMAKQGLHFQKVNHFGTYTFEQGVAVDYAYRLDYQDSIKDEQQYFQLFQDSGWQHIDTTNGWRYFRQEIRAGKVPEMFTDSETKIKKYERVRAYLLSGTSLICPPNDCQPFEPGGRGLAVVVRTLPEWFNSLVAPSCPRVYRRFL